MLTPLLTHDPAETPRKAQEAARGFSDLGFAHVKTAGLATTSYALQGMFYVSASGWGMLNVPNSLVRGAFDALHEPGAQLPPSKGKILNAHISVLDKDEVRKIGRDNISERGHFYRYTLGPVKTCEPSGWDEMSRVWFIEVRSPELEKLRKSYGLAPLLHGNPFHITVAVRKKSVLRDNDVTKEATDKLVTDGEFTGTIQELAANYAERIRAAALADKANLEKAGAKKIPKAIQKIVDECKELEEEDTAGGIYVMYNPGPPARAHLDVMDWGDDKLGNRIQAVLEREVGKENVERVNEGGKPDDPGWVRVEAACEKRSHVPVLLKKADYDGFSPNVPWTVQSVLDTKTDAELHGLAVYYSPTPYPGQVVINVEPSGNPGTAYSLADKFRSTLGYAHVEVVYEGLNYRKRGWNWIELNPVRRAKYAAANHASVVEIGGKKICPHCGKPIADGEIYTDAKGWKFHRPCFQKGKGSIKLGHYLVTGHSGAGKSTLAQRLSEKTGLPVEHLDDAPGFKDFLRANPGVGHMDPADPNHAAYTAMRRGIVENALAQQDPRIIEGHQLAAFPELWKGHQGLLVDAPMRQIIRQRLARDRVKHVAKGKVAPEAARPGTAWSRERGRVAREIYGLGDREIQPLRADPSILKLPGGKAPLDSIKMGHELVKRATGYMPALMLRGIPMAARATSSYLKSIDPYEPGIVGHVDRFNKAMAAGLKKNSPTELLSDYVRYGHELLSAPGFKGGLRGVDVIENLYKSDPVQYAYRKATGKPMEWSLSKPIPQEGRYGLKTHYHSFAHSPLQAQRQLVKELMRTDPSAFLSSSSGGHASSAAAGDDEAAFMKDLIDRTGVADPSKLDSKAQADLLRQYNTTTPGGKMLADKFRATLRYAPHAYPWLGRALVAPKQMIDATTGALDLIGGPPTQKLAASVTLGKNDSVDVPHKQQETDHTCGPAAIRSVLGAFKDHVPPESSVARAAGADPESGTPPDRLMAAAGRHGLRSQAQQEMTLTHLKQMTEAGKPVVVCMQAHGGPGDHQGWKDGHYVVVTKVDDEHVHYRDSANESADSSMKHQDFLDHWHDQDEGGKKYRRLGIAMWGEEKDAHDAYLERCLQPPDPQEFDLAAVARV